MKKIIFTTIVGLAAILYACKHEPDALVPAPVTIPIGGLPSSEVCFQSEVLPLLQTNCAKSGCHDAVSKEGDYVLDSYNNITRRGVVPGNATNSKIYKVLFENGSDKMPPPPNPDLTAAQKALIGKWINEGAKNTTGCGVACDSSQFTFAANIKPMMQTYCVGCHGGTAPSGGINLSEYGGVRQQAISGRLYNSVIQAPGYSAMPKSAGKLSDCQIAQLRKWIAAGYQNN
jgi:cytochrome c553